MIGSRQQTSFHVQNDHNSVLGQNGKNRNWLKMKVLNIYHQGGKGMIIKVTIIIKVAKVDHQGVDHRQDKNWEMQPIWELSTKGQFSENEIHWIARIPDTGWLSY